MLGRDGNRCGEKVSHAYCHIQRHQSHADQRKQRIALSTDVSTDQICAARTLDNKICAARTLENNSVLQMKCHLQCSERAAAVCSASVTIVLPPLLVAPVADFNIKKYLNDFSGETFCIDCVGTMIILLLVELL